MHRLRRRPLPACCGTENILAEFLDMGDHVLVHIRGRVEKFVNEGGVWGIAPFDDDKESVGSVS